MDNAFLGNTAPSSPSDIGSVMPLSRRVAVVEDDRMLSMLLEEVCQHAGHTVVGSAHTAQDGLALVRSMRPDCLLVDYQLRSELNGLDVLERARRMLPGIFTVLISGWDHRELDARLAEVRPDGVLKKPLRTAELVSLLAARPA
jgi:DNA-binding response OmpR family regulator